MHVSRQLAQNKRLCCCGTSDWDHKLTIDCDCNHPLETSMDHKIKMKVALPRNIWSPSIQKPRPLNRSRRTEEAGGMFGVEIPRPRRSLIARSARSPLTPSVSDVIAMYVTDAAL